MCGRYSLEWDTDELARYFGLSVEAMPRLEPRYNVAPSQPVPVVHVDRDRADRRMTLMHWGLIPRWAKDPSIGYRMVNARAESAATKPAYKAAIRYRRGLLPAGGFYEWKTERGGKQPYRFVAADGSPLALAGLYETWCGPNGEQLDSCTILTTDASDIVKPIHHRMPVIITPDAFERWLDPQRVHAHDVADLLRPLGGDRLRCHRVSRRLNSPEADDPKLIEPVEAPPPPASQPPLIPDDGQQQLF